MKTTNKFNMKAVDINKFFNNPIVKRLERENHIPPKEFNELQKTAIAKAILYIISADGVITEEEQQFFTQLCADLKVDSDIMEKAIALSDDVMFDTLQTVTDEQEAYIMACLNEAANVDNELSEEEGKLINTFATHIQKGEKPKNFYTKILTF